MPQKRKRALKNTIIGMTDPTGVQDASAAAQIRELQENIRRLQAALDALVIPSAGPSSTINQGPKTPRFIAGRGIELIPRKDFVQIGAIDDPYGPLYEVTEVDQEAGTLSAARIWQDGSPNESSKLMGVLYQTLLPVNVGDQGQIVRLADGKLAFTKDYGWLWEVTEVTGSTCTIRRVNSNDTLDAASELTWVLYRTDSALAAGTRGQLSREPSGDPSGTIYFHPGGWDYTLVSGYDDTKTQYLRHVNGVLNWIDSGEC